MRTTTCAAALAAAAIALAATSARALEIQNLDSKPYTLKITEKGRTRDYTLAAGRNEGSFCTSDCSIEIVGVGRIDPIDAAAPEAKYMIEDGVLADAAAHYDHNRRAGQ